MTDTPTTSAADVEAVVARLASVTEADAYATPWTFGELCKEAASLILSLQASLDAVEGQEAVAWRWKYPHNRHWTLRGVPCLYPNVICEPLYASPPSKNELQVQADEVARLTRERDENFADALAYSDTAKFQRERAEAAEARATTAEAQVAALKEENSRHALDYNEVRAKLDELQASLAFIEHEARSSRYGVTIEWVVGAEGEAYGFRFGRQRYIGPPLKTASEAIERARSDLRRAALASAETQEKVDG